MGILEHDAKRAAQVVFLYMADINTIICDRTLLYVVKTVNQIGYGGLSRPCGSHKSQLLPRLRIQADVMEHCMPRLVSKVHILKPHITGKSCVCGRAVLTGTFPGPQAGPFRYLCHFSAFIHTDIDKGHISPVCLRFLIHHIKNTFCPCQGHDNGIGLLGYLGKGLVKALCKLEIRSNLAQGQPCQAA